MGDQSATCEHGTEPARRVSDEQVGRDLAHAFLWQMTAEDTFLMSAGYPGDLRDARAAIAAERERAETAKRERDEARRSKERLHRDMQKREAEIKRQEHRFWIDLGYPPEWRSLPIPQRRHEYAVRLATAEDRADKADRERDEAREQFRVFEAAMKEACERGNAELVALRDREQCGGQVTEALVEAALSTALGKVMWLWQKENYPAIVRLRRSEMHLALEAALAARQTGQPSDPADQAAEKKARA